MSSPVSLLGAGNHSTRAESIGSPARSRTRASAAWRGVGTRPIIVSSPNRAFGPDIRTTAIAAGGRPDDRAKIVSRSDIMNIYSFHAHQSLDKAPAESEHAATYSFHPLTPRATTTASSPDAGETDVTRSHRQQRKSARPRDQPLPAAAQA